MRLFLSVLGLAEMGIIFPIATLIVSYSLLVARKVLTIHHCCGYCWSMLPQH